MWTILDHLLLVFLGAGGWVAAQFIGSPVRGFYNIRKEVREFTLSHWDQPEAHSIEPSDRAKYYEGLKGARETSLKLGTQLISFEQSESMASWFVKKMGFEPAKAGNILRTISLEFGTTQEDRSKNFRRLDVALKFQFDPKKPFYNPYNPGPYGKS
jgi:hypothetical protein